METHKLSEESKLIFEAYFPDLDLDKVNIILDESRLNGADAVTFGNNIYMKPSEYSQLTVDGMVLIGHELVHVQQYKTVGYFKFLRKYVSDYKNNLKIYNNNYDAYQNIPFEQQAFNTEQQLRFDFTDRFK